MTEVTGRKAGLKFLSRWRHFGGSKSDRNLRRRPHMTMKIAGGLCEGGIVVGNLYDKYGSRHLFLRLLMKGFDTALSDLVAKASPRSIHDDLLAGSRTLRKSATNRGSNVIVISAPS